MTSSTQPQSKKNLYQIITTTFLAGFLVILPAYLAILVLNKIIKTLIAGLIVN